MPKKRQELRAKGLLDKKLAMYAIAGAAAVVAPNTAKAGIILTTVNQTVNSTGTYNFNLSGPSSNDITITANPSEIDAIANTGAGVVMNSGDVAALAFGALIDPTNTGSFGSGGKMVNTSGGLLTGGYWSSTGGDAYLGFYFNGPANPQAGWADIQTSGNPNSTSFTIVNYAYETNPNTAITAGQTSDTPEPSTMALIGLGAAGLIALRRRRASNA
jgi:hypothetical protein